METYDSDDEYHSKLLEKDELTEEEFNWILEFEKQKIIVKMTHDEFEKLSDEEKPSSVLWKDKENNEIMVLYKNKTKVPKRFESRMIQNIIFDLSN